MAVIIPEMKDEEGSQDCSRLFDEPRFMKNYGRRDIATRMNAHHTYMRLGVNRTDGCGVKENEFV